MEKANHAWIEAGCYGTFICIIEILALFMKVLYVKVGAVYVIYLFYVIDNKIFLRPLKGEGLEITFATFTQCLWPSYFAVDFLHLKKTRPLNHEQFFVQTGLNSQ